MSLWEKATISSKWYIFVQTLHWPIGMDEVIQWTFFAHSIFQLKIWLDKNKLWLMMLVVNGLNTNIKIQIDGVDTEKDIIDS